MNDPRLTSAFDRKASTISLHDFFGVKMGLSWKIKKLSPQLPK